MKLKYSFETMKMRDKVIAVPVGKGADAFHGALKLNKTAAAILELLRKETNEEQIAEAMAARFDAPRETIQADVRKYVAEFKDRGLIG